MAGYHFHPALLDACFQVLASMLTAGAEPTPWVLVQVGAVQLLQSPPGELFCHVTALPPDPMLPERAGADLRIVNSLGSTVAEITGLWAQRLAAAAASREAADLFVSLDWEAAPVPAPRLSSGRWLLLGGGDLGRSLQQALSAAGHPAIHLVEAHRLAEALDSTVSVTFGARAPTAVVHLVDQPGPALTEPEAIATALASAYGSVLGTVQTLANRGYRDAPRLWLVTRGAQAVGREPIAVAQAAVLGLARVVAAEHAELRCGCIDLDPAGPRQDAHPLLAELLADDAEEEIVWRGTERRVARLSRWRTSSGEREAAVAIRQDASYLVTGGLGGLGLSVAHWLAAAGPRVTVVCADVADRARLATLLHELATSGLPLRGVVHAAGLIDDGLLLQQTPARLRTVMAAKVHGALNLHELTRERELDFFVMYSSAAGMLGTAGQGNYAAVNTFLDALAHHRRAQALPALSVAWGPFSGVGGAAAHDLRGARLGARGLASLTAEQGLAALAQLLASRQTQVGVMQLDLRQWAGFNQAAAASRRLSRLWREQSPEAASQKHGLRDRLATADPATRPALLAAGLRRQAAQVLRISEATVDVDMPLMSLGMDSLMGLELRNGIEALLGIKVPSTLLWTYPTVAGLSAHLLAELHLGPPAAPLPPAVAPAGPVEDLSEDELAQLIAAKFEELK
jgi:acyl carrier protein/short-subunit dehydrogenase